MFKNLLCSFVVKISLLAVLLLVGSVFNTSQGQTVLTAGDIAIIGFKTNNNTDGGDDGIKMLTFVDLTCGTIFFITDNNWDNGSADWACTNDEYGIQITVTSKICAGSVIYIEDDGSNSFTPHVSSGSISVSTLGNPWGTNSGLSSQGDNAFVFTGTRAASTFIYGFKNNTSWADGACGGSGNRSNTGLPATLTNGTTAVKPSSSQDQWHYKCSALTSGTKATLLTSIGNASNWTSSVGQTWDASSCSFSVTDPCTAPTHQATSFSATSITNTTATVKWSNCPSPGTNPGNTQVLVIVRAGSAVATDPTSGSSYTANAAFASGSAIGSGYVVFIGSGTQVSLTGLVAGTTYYVAVYEYSCSGLCYNTNELPGNFGTTSLPVHLIYFNADKEENNIVEFEWATASEINNDYFEIEASKDGINFLSVGKVKGSGNSRNYETYNYSWFSEKEFQYFRLKQVDYDGEFQYSTIETITSDEAIDLEVFPVPASEELFVKINSQEEVTISILDLLGKKIYSALIPSTSTSSSVFPLDIKGLTNGTYILVVSSDNEVVSRKFSKL